MRLRATIPVLTCCLGAASALQLEGMRATRAQPLRSAAPLMEADAVLDKRAERRRIMAKDVVHRNVPYYEDLKMETFLNFAKDHKAGDDGNGKVMDYLPCVEKERLKLPR